MQAQGSRTLSRNRRLRSLLLARRAASVVYNHWPDLQLTNELVVQVTAGVERRKMSSTPTAGGRGEPDGRVAMHARAALPVQAVDVSKQRLALVEHGLQATAR
jgi:hypothetical protein